MKFKSFYDTAYRLDQRVQEWLEKNHNIHLENVKIKKMGENVLLTIFYTTKI